MKKDNVDINPSILQPGFEENNNNNLGKMHKVLEDSSTNNDKDCFSEENNDFKISNFLISEDIEKIQVENNEDFSAENEEKTEKITEKVKEQITENAKLIAKVDKELFEKRVNDHKKRLDIERSAREYRIAKFFRPDIIAKGDQNGNKIFCEDVLKLWRACGEEARCRYRELYNEKFERKQEKKNPAIFEIEIPKPKRPLNAFTVFTKFNYRKFKDKNPNFSSYKLNSLMSEVFNTLSEKEKEVFELLSNKDRERYYSEIEMYNLRTGKSKRINEMKNMEQIKFLEKDNKKPQSLFNKNVKKDKKLIPEKNEEKNYFNESYISYNDTNLDVDILYNELNNLISEANDILNKKRKRSESE